MPAAAVIPAPIAYIIFAAVKKLVVGFWANTYGPPQGVYWMSLLLFWRPGVLFTECASEFRTFTVNKLECLKQAYACTVQHGINKQDFVLICWF